MRPDAELAIDALHVRVNNNERGAGSVSREAVLEFEEFWRRHADAPLKVSPFFISIYLSIYTYLSIYMILIHGMDIVTDIDR